MFSAVSLRARFSLAAFSIFLFPILMPSPVVADVFEYFAGVAGTPNGEFGWDDFGTTGSGYTGPHLPDQTGVGSSITANAGGIITSTKNLYSFFSIPTWNVNLSGLDLAQPFTSIAVQFAVSTDYSVGQFSLGGQLPDEFVYLGDGPVVGGFPVKLFWAEWQGLAADSEYTISLNGTGQHQSLLGVKASYFNTITPYNIRAIPEPGASCFLVGILGLALMRNRCRRG
jgi:hypothetical protein